MEIRTALITGASRGIGKACALALAAAGHRIAIAGRSRERLEETAGEIRGCGVEAFIAEMDMSAADSIANGIGKTAKEFGRIDILVN
ncbi:MAG: SDR family NAD(P)-dependent oxidoreductase, partial [Rhizomicrobium sp.]